MEYMIATFRSRNATVKVYNYLISEYSFNCALVSTPRQANVGCGLSIKFSTSDYSFMANGLAGFETFAGIFKVTVTNNRTIVTRM